MNKPTRYYSNKQEKSVAIALNGKLTPNSGASKFSGGDVVIKEASMLIECKCAMSEKNSVSIKKEWINNLRKECLAMGKTEWAIVFDFGNIGDEYAVIPLEFLKDLLDIREESLYD